MVRGSFSASPVREFRVAAGIYSRDFRIICDCQNHRASRRARERRFRRRGLALAIALSVGVGFVQVPSDARLLPERLHVQRAGLVSQLPAERQSEKADPLQRAVREMLFTSPAAEQPRIITEKVREEFFRTEIPYGALIYREAKRNNLAPELVAAVIKAESDFRPRLRSSKNALGLMQILPSTGALMGASDLFDPADNVRAGTRYLRYLHRRFNGDQTKVLAAYNAGEGNIARYGGVPPFRETHEYLRRVAVNRAEYSRRLARRLIEAQLGVRLAEDAPKKNTSRRRSAKPALMAAAHERSGTANPPLAVEASAVPALAPHELTPLAHRPDSASVAEGAALSEVTEPASSAVETSDVASSPVDTASDDAVAAATHSGD